MPKTPGPSHRRAPGAIVTPRPIEADSALGSLRVLDRRARPRRTVSNHHISKGREGQATWADLDATPQVLYALLPWMDVPGVTEIGLRTESNETKTVEVALRVGVQLHILSRILRQQAARRCADREPLPRQRVNIHTLLRLENQATASNSAATKSSWRFRDRFAVAYPLNRANTTSDGTVYLTSDTDIAGNVWEWVGDWYRPDYYAELAAHGLARNPQGPNSSFDPLEPGTPKRVMRSGSFLCTDQFCSRYMVGTRGKGDVDTGTNHLGFRGVIAARKNVS